MPLPEMLRVKLSSEAAEYVALTPVVVRELRLGELLEHIVSAAGLDAGRVRDILRRGTLVSGGTRFRWEGWEGDAGEIAAALARLPQPEPSRPFNAAKCVRAVLSGAPLRLEIRREAAEARRLFRRRNFWQSLMEAAGEPAYATYSYKDRADHYRRELPGEARRKLMDDAGLLRFNTLAKQVRAGQFEAIELIVER
jgi:hypothetical protein